MRYPCNRKVSRLHLQRWQCYTVNRKYTLTKNREKDACALSNDTLHQYTFNGNRNREEWHHLRKSGCVADLRWHYRGMLHCTAQSAIHLICRRRRRCGERFKMVQAPTNQKFVVHILLSQVAILTEKVGRPVCGGSYGNRGTVRWYSGQRNHGRSQGCASTCLRRGNRRSWKRWS